MFSHCCSLSNKTSLKRRPEPKQGLFANPLAKMIRNWPKVTRLLRVTFGQLRMLTAKHIANQLAKVICNYPISDSHLAMRICLFPVPHAHAYAHTHTHTQNQTNKDLPREVIDASGGYIIMN